MSIHNSETTFSTASLLTLITGGSCCKSSPNLEKFRPAPFALLIRSPPDFSVPSAPALSVHVWRLARVDSRTSPGRESTTIFQSVLPSSHGNSCRTGQLHDNLSTITCGKCERYCSDRLSRSEEHTS